MVASEAEAFRHFLLVYLVVNLAKGLCGAVQSVLVNVLGKHLSYEARSQLFRKIVELDMVYFDNTMTGNTTAKLTNDVNQMVTERVIALSVAATQVSRCRNKVHLRFAVQVVPVSKCLIDTI